MQDSLLSDRRMGETRTRASSAPGVDVPSIATPGQFEAALVRFINQILPEIHEPLKVSPQVDCRTPLFESGLIDSLAILHLIGFVEKATGRPVPARMVVMKHFRTVEAISQAFWTNGQEV
jgi:acyl carrier protein